MAADINWQGIFDLTVPILEIILRGSVMYVVLFAFIRLALRRVGGTFGLADILMVTLIAAAAQNAMARDQHSVTDGLILAGTIVFWSYAFDWLGHRFPLVQRFYNPPPLLLVKDGMLMRRNMRLELITEDELMGQLRRFGVTELAEVREAHMESDGSITVKKLKGKEKRRRQ